MPYASKRRYRKKRSYRPRRGSRAPWYNRPIRYSVSDIASMAYKGVNYLKGLVNSEVYKFDTDTSSSPSTAGTITHLSAIAQGDAENSRSGNSIYLRSVLVNGVMQIHASATSTTYRIMIVSDSQQVGDTSPAISDILNSVGVTSALNRGTVGRFSVLYDKMFNINTAATPTRCHKIFLPMLRHVRFNGAATTDIQRNGIYLVLISNEATNTPSFAYFSRCSYHDN